jgi:hypothetical protein
MPLYARSVGICLTLPVQIFCTANVSPWTHKVVIQWDSEQGITVHMFRRLTLVRFE